MLGEFSGHLDANVGDGDVKYHMGFSQSTLWTHGNPVHLSLMPNPSHLEAVCPVLMGVTRAKQKLKGDITYNRTLPILLHGDASFAGQGVIYEVLNMSDLSGYTVGGTIHIIVNNQIGFTTTPQEARSTPQATDVATMLDFPIFHVNADEPEAALRCISLALQFRYKFKKDVVIDLIGYRRYGTMRPMSRASPNLCFIRPLIATRGFGRFIKRN
jgi:2-oxoglutarate dehydrogenase E1 component